MLQMTYKTDHTINLNFLQFPQPFLLWYILNGTKDAIRIFSRRLCRYYAPITEIWFGKTGFFQGY